MAGNTEDKKRTYSIMVSGYLDEIIVDFDVKGGNKGGTFEPFIQDKIYDAILVKRK